MSSKGEIEKVRRCREHVTTLRDNETCSFVKHSKHNKIEEMSEQEAKILDWVENEHYGRIVKK